MQIVDPDSLPFDPGFEEGADGDEPADDSRKGIRATRRGLAAALWRRFASAGQFRARAKHSSS
jgi:hypothetical protein